MKECKKCNKEFEPSKGLINFCSMKCRQGKQWTEEDKKRKSSAAVNSEKVKSANKILGDNKIKSFPGLRINGYRITKENICSVCDKIVLTTIVKNQLYHNKCWRSISGGYKQGSSRGKSGWYEGYWCDSSWELAWVIYNLDHEIKFERNKEGFEYEYENKKYKYYPDFILEDGTYIEIKNYNCDRLRAKLKMFPNSIEVLYKENLKEIFNYIHNKYGKDFIKLYCPIV